MHYYERLEEDHGVEIAQWKWERDELLCVVHRAVGSYSSIENAANDWDVPLAMLQFAMDLQT